MTRLLSRVVLVLLALSLLPRPAQADLRAFSAGSLIIPMDACYQASPDQLQPSYCVDGKAPNDGAAKAYGLVYLLLKRGVTLYLVTNSSKTAVSAIDMSLTRSGGGPPVGTYNQATRTFNDFTSAQQIDYRGAPFVIDVAEAQTALDLLATDPILSTFTSVAIHVAYDSFVAPIAMRMNGVPPRIAVFVPNAGEGGSVGTEGIPLMRAYLRRAGLDYPAAVGNAATHGDIFDMLTPADVIGGALSAHYQVAWFPHYSPASGSGTTSVLNAVRDFVNAGGMIFAECSSISTFESNSQTRFMTTAGISINRLPICYPGNTPGFRRLGEPVNGYTACYDPKPVFATSPGAGLSFPDPASPFIQIGDFNFYKNSGVTEDWLPKSDSAWNPGVQPLLRAQDTDAGRNGSNIVSMTYKDNDTNKGQIIYFGGHFYGDGSAPMTAGLRVVLNTLMFAKPTLSTRYATRSGPTLARVSGRTVLFLGSFLEQNAPLASYDSAASTGWIFPQVPGQFRAYDASGLSGGTQSLAASGGGLWNAANLIPSPGARKVYTSSNGGAAPSLLELTEGNLPSLGANPFALPAGYSAADEAGLLARVRAAPLGGVDHSTAAIVGAQSVVQDGATRSSMAYVGALDGMLHAFVVEGSAGTPGSELWSFVPYDQLGSLRHNGAALDSSPAVGDIYEKIGGVRRWRTLLTLSQGRGGTNVYGLDVSDPTRPALLWHRGTTATGVVLGNSRGSSLTTCPTATNPYQSFVVVAGSKVGGGSGLTAVALSGSDGRELWRFSTSYSRTLPGTSAVIPNDLPAPPALADVNQASSCEERAYVVDLEGKIWELNTLTGANVNGTSPLADVGLTPGGRVQPIGAAPALYIDKSNGHRMLAVVTGGMDWAYAADSYALYTFDIDPSARQPDTGQGVAPRRSRVALSLGYRGYAPPTVSGGDVYVLSSNGTLGGTLGSTITDAGMLTRINLASATVTHSANLTKGAGAFVMDGDGTMYGATARDVVKLQATGADLSGKKLRNDYSKPFKRRIHLETR